MSEPTDYYNVSDRRFYRALSKSTVLIFAVCFCFCVSAQDIGALRVTVFDQDWDVPVNDAQVTLLDKNQRKPTDAEGQVLFENLAPGRYTLSVGATGFGRKVIPSVTIVAGQVQVVACKIQADYTDMEEFVVKDFEITTGSTELAQLSLRSQSSSLMDNIGADMMSKAGVSTAAAAMRLVTGANVQDGKYAVIRGLGDRYTSTLLNGVRLPTSDKDKRAVQLDQYPAAMIESIQVTKTFAPDQQGDASGGGINIVTKSVPDKTILSASVSTEYDSNATGNNDFKTPEGGNNDFGGLRNLKNQPFWNPGNMDDPRGLTTVQASSKITSDAPPPNYGFKYAAGDVLDLGDWRLGSLINGSYSQKYKYRKGEKNVLLKIPDTTELVVLDKSSTKTVETSTDEQLWSTGLTLGAKNEYNDIKLTTLYTHMAREVVETRYEPISAASDSPPDRRTGNVTTTRTREFSTLSQYTESGNGSVQLAGKHVIEPLNRLELDWTGSYNISESTEPDRQTFSGENGDGYVSTKNSTTTDRYGNPLTDTSVIKGDLNRRWQDIREESRQAQVNAKQPFTVLENEGYLKTGLFADHLERRYRSRDYTERIEVDAEDEYDFSQFPASHPINSSSILNESSTDYNGKQELTAYYAMLRAPLPDWLDIIGGARMENTLIDTKVWSAVPGMDGKLFVTRVVQDSNGINSIEPNAQITEQEGAATIDQTDLLPAIAANFKMIDDVSIRFAYSQTIARPTFKELTPVKYSDIDPSLLFVGNQNLQMSSLNNYDARVEWRPGKGTDMLAASVFYKTIADPIQYTTYSDPQPGSDKQYIFPENYENAWIEGVEFEARKGLGFIWGPLKDLSVGSNLTLQDSFVNYTTSLIKSLEQVGVDANGRVMDGQPNYLFNVNLVYQNDPTGFMTGLFYNYKGETFVSGEASSGSLYTPNVVELPFGSLDYTIGLKFAKRWRVGIDVKNILDPLVESVYRRPTGDLPNTSYRYGRTFGISLGYDW